jgi:competence protein ComEA
VPPDGGLFADQTPLAWSDVVTTWPEDADLDPEPPPSSVIDPSRIPEPSRGGESSPVRDSSGVGSARLRREAVQSPGWEPGQAPGGGPGQLPGLEWGRSPGREPVRGLWEGPIPEPAPAPAREPGDGGEGDRLARPIDPSAWAAQREPWQPAAADDEDPAPSVALTSAGAFGGGSARFGPFDPGRRGVKALAAVAVVVVLIAAFLAWRARPRVDPVAAPPAPTTFAEETPAPGSAGAASTGPAAEVVVSVGGKVGRPGLVRLPAGARVADAIAAAGGARPGTDVALLNLARKVVDGEQILVGVSAPPGAPPAGPAGAPAPAGPINLNTATLGDLDSLPGVGPVLAQRILDARTAAGGFRAVTDLRQVEGIGSARYDQLKDLVTV